MIRHILFWNYTEKVKEKHGEEEALRFMQDSVVTMNGNIDGLLQAEIGKNIAGGYDLVFYAEFTDEAALKAFMNHPLHVAHRERCKNIVTDRLCGDLVTGDNRYLVVVEEGETHGLETFINFCSGRGFVFRSGFLWKKGDRTDAGAIAADQG